MQFQGCKVIVMVLLELKNLNVSYGSKKNIVKAVKNVSLTINEGDIYGLVGESGCGKSTIGKSIVNLLKPNSGSILYNGKDYDSFNKSNKEFYQFVQMIFQDPYGSLNPRMKIGEAFVDVMKSHNIFDSKEQRIKKTEDLLNKIGLSKKYINRYPHEFSGGQRQRICIARSLILKPKLIIADEPVSALDVSIQSEILELIKKLNNCDKLTFLFISHDLAVVKNLCNNMSVMKNGEIVESGDTKKIINSPETDYTKLLINAVPKF